MSRTIGLVSCVSKKAAIACAATDLYLSPWFRHARRYVAQNSDEWFILSAKHGLLSPEAVIEPYDTYLASMPASERREWANLVLRDLLPRTAPADLVLVLAGKKYREHLIAPLEAGSVTVEIPLAGLFLGQQLSWLKRH